MVVNGERRGSRWRIAGWGFAVALLALPFFAMMVTNEVTWSLSDFIVFGAMLAIAGGLFEVAVRMSRSGAYRIGAAFGVLAGFLLVWVNGAVGFFGDEDNPANFMFAGVLAIAVAGAFIADFKPGGMARAMLATAAAQLLVGVIGLAAGLGSPGAAGVYEVVLGTTLFGGLWLVSAGLFRKAHRDSTTA